MSSLSHSLPVWVVGASGLVFPEDRLQTPEAPATVKALHYLSWMDFHYQLVIQGYASLWPCSRVGDNWVVQMASENQEWDPSNTILVRFASGTLEVEHSLSGLSAPSLGLMLYKGLRFLNSAAFTDTCAGARRGTPTQKYLVVKDFFRSHPHMSENIFFLDQLVQSRKRGSGRRVDPQYFIALLDVIFTDMASRNLGLKWPSRPQVYERMVMYASPEGVMELIVRHKIRGKVGFLRLGVKYNKGRLVEMMEGYTGW